MKFANVVMFTVCISTGVWTCALPLMAQQDPRPSLSPVPFYPRDGNIPEDLREKSVFLDLSTSEIVVSYVDEDSLGQRVTMRFGLHRNVDPV